MTRKRLLDMDVVGCLLTAGRAAISEPCPVGQWCQWNGHWYRFTKLGTWEDAQAEAETAGGYLVTIDNEDENAWISTAFASVNDSPSCALWTGFNDRETEGAWVWEGNPELCSYLHPGGGDCYTNWDSGEPNNDPNPGGEDCGTMWDGRCTGEPIGSWNDYPCTYYSTLRGVVESEINPIPTLSEWGVVAMTLLVLTAATLVFLRRRTAQV